MEIGWTKPMEAPADWDDAKIKTVNFNSRALNALFSAVTNGKFKKISPTETAKKAWTIFQTTYEGTKAIKDSKPRLAEAIGHLGGGLRPPLIRGPQIVIIYYIILLSHMKKRKKKKKGLQMAITKSHQAMKACFSQRPVSHREKS